MLATTPGLAASRGLEAPPPGAAGPVGGSGQDRLVQGFVGLGDGARPRGAKRHLVVDKNGIPLAVTLSAANVHDVRMLEETISD